MKDSWLRLIQKVKYSWLGIPKKWRWLILGVVTAGLIAGVSYAVVPLFIKPGTKTVELPKVKKEAPKPKTLPSPLTGVEVTPELAKRPIWAMVVENHTNSRPQSGLAEAGVVYEALAEGGITRFLAFYLEAKPSLVGPIRSLRTYFVSWALEFGAPVGHVGYNYDAMELINPLGLRSLNQFTFGGSYYRSRDRFAPHNVYTTTDLIDKLLVQTKYNVEATFKVTPRKKDAAPVAPATATNPSIKINYSYPSYNVEYRYDQTGNDYLRFMAGTAHNDREKGQIRVKNVVVMYMPTSYGLTKIGEQTVILGQVGSGKALVFTDGGVAAGTWKKPSHSARTQLLDANGKEIELNRGNTWYSVIPTGNLVTY